MHSVPTDSKSGSYEDSFLNAANWLVEVREISVEPSNISKVFFQEKEPLSLQVTSFRVCYWSLR